MDFLSAFSGLERIAIIGGAMLVGYWGFRLFATDRTPALVFMGIACAVLFGALFTGASHLRNVGESYQLATASPAVSPVAVEVEVEVDQLTAAQPPQSADPILMSEEMTEETVEETIEETIAAAIEEPADDAASQQAAAESGPALQTAPDLLSSQELGGRIVRVKSGSVLLEWSPRGG
jgi:hypothetical protein